MVWDPVPREGWLKGRTKTVLSMIQGSYKQQRLGVGFPEQSERADIDLWEGGVEVQIETEFNHSPSRRENRVPSLFLHKGFFSSQSE